VQKLAASGPNDPILDKLLDVGQEVRERSGRTNLGESREEMPRWTDTLKEWLDSLGPRLSVDSARGLYYYLNEVKRQMELLST